MALIDSEKAFQKRCEEMHDGLFEKLQGQNIGSFSTLAFALGARKIQFRMMSSPSWQMQCLKLSLRWAQRQFLGGCTLSLAPSL